MNLGNKILLITILLISVLFCSDEIMSQGSTSGVSMTGVTLGDNYEWLKSLGLICIFRGDRGVMKDDSGNVYQWRDLTVSGGTLFSSTAKPSFVASYADQFGIAFPCISFTAGAGARLTSGSQASFVQGVNKSLTLYQINCPETNGLNICSIALGFTTSTNVQADTFNLRPAANTHTTSQVAQSVSSNQANVLRSSLLNYGTNAWMIQGAIYDGSNVYSIDGYRLSGPSTYTSGYTRRCDNITVGGWLRSAYVNQYTGYCAGLLVFSNALSTVDHTNVVSWIRQYYPVQQ